MPLDELKPNCTVNAVRAGRFTKVSGLMNPSGYVDHDKTIQGALRNNTGQHA